MTGISSPSLVLEQFYAFLEAAALGGALAACYDLYRAVRMQGLRRPPPAVLFITDCLFWVVAALACIGTFIFRRWGEVHFYTYLGLAGGSAVYFYRLSRFLLPLWSGFFAAVFRFFHLTFRFFARVFTLVAAPFRWSARQTVRVAQKSSILFNCCSSRIFGLFRRK